MKLPAIFIFAASLLGAQARTFFVDPATGNDANAGTSQGAAWAHLPGSVGFSGAGWVQLINGDSVIVKGGSVNNLQVKVSTTWYSGSAAFNSILIQSGDQASPAFGSGRAIVDGQNTRTYGFFFTGTSGVTLDGFEVRNIASGGVDVAFDPVNGSSGVVVGGNAAAPYTTIKRCYVHDTLSGAQDQGHGIETGHSQHLRFTQNTIGPNIGFKGCELNGSGGDNDFCEIDHNYLTDTQTHGIVITASHCDIHDNIVNMNGPWNQQPAYACKVNNDNNDLWNNIFFETTRTQGAQGFGVHGNNNRFINNTLYNMGDSGQGGQYGVGMALGFEFVTTSGNQLHNNISYLFDDVLGHIQAFIYDGSISATMAYNDLWYSNGSESVITYGHSGAYSQFSVSGFQSAQPGIAANNQQQAPNFKGGTLPVSFVGLVPNTDYFALTGSTPSAISATHNSVTGDATHGLSSAANKFSIDINGTARTLWSMGAYELNGLTPLPMVLAFTVGDAETPAANLVVSAASSNPALIPSSGLVLGGSSGNRTLAITPTANLSGTSTITLGVQDGSGGTNSAAFAVTVTHANRPPTIQQVSSPQTISENGSLTVQLTLADPDTALSSLALSGSSVDTTLVPNANIVFGGSGANRTATITPAANRFGTNNITLTVSDGAGGSAQTTFALQVAFVNSLPTISALSGVTILTNTVSSSQQFSIGDLETPANNLVLSVTSSNPSVVPTNGVILGGGGQTRTVAVASGNNAGSATIIVTVTDSNNGSRSSAFGVTVNVPSGGGGNTNATGIFVSAPDSPVAPNDGSSGTDVNHPWTFTKALNSGVVQSGTTVWMRRGTYVGSFSGAPNHVVFRPFPGDEWWNGASHVVIDRQLADCATVMNDTPAALDHRNWNTTYFFDAELRNSVPRCELTSGENYQRPDLLGNINGQPHGNIFYHCLLRDGMNNTAWQFHVAGTGDEMRGCISILGGTAASYEGGGMGGCFYAQNVSGGTPIRFTDNLMGEGFNRLGELNGTNPDGPQNNVVWDGNIGWGGGAPGCYAVGCSMGSGMIFGTFNNNQDITVNNNVIYTWLQNKGNYDPARSGGSASFGVFNGTPFTHSNYQVSNNIICGSFAFTIVNPVSSSFRNNTFISGIYEVGHASLGLASGYTISGNTYYKASSGDSVWLGSAPSESGATVLVGPPTQNVIRRKVVQHPTDATNNVMNLTILNWQGLSSIPVDLSQDDYGTPFLQDGKNYLVICGLNPLVAYAVGTKNGTVQIPVNTGFAPLDPACNPFWAHNCPLPNGMSGDQPYSPGTAGGGGHALTTLPEFLPLQIIRTN